MTQHNKMFHKWFTWILGPCSFLNIKRYPSKSLRTGSGVSRTRKGGAETYNPFLVHYSPLSSISSKVLSTSSLSLYASSCDRPPARPAQSLPSLYFFTAVFLLFDTGQRQSCVLLCTKSFLGNRDPQPNFATYITWIRIGLSRENAVLYEICPYLIDLCTVC